jgi:hypothetical protein
MTGHPMTGRFLRHGAVLAKGGVGWMAKAKSLSGSAAR